MLSREKNVNKQQEHYVLSHFPNIAYNVVAIAASKGGIKAISEILSVLPSNFPAAIVVVQHMCPQYRSYMAQILSRQTSLQVKQAQEGELLYPGSVYTPVPDQHLLVSPSGKIALSQEAKVNFVRPAADKLLMSVASSYKARAIAIVLTGRGSDGLLGALAIKKQGGMVIAQDQATCECFDMPKAAIATGKVDLVLAPKAIASTLINTLMTAKVA